MTWVLIDAKPGEATSHSLLAQHKLAPQLLARFQNGLIYRFIRGHVSSSEDLTSEPVWRGVARRLGQWHAILPINSCGKTAVVADAGMDVLLKSSAPVSTASLEEINAITPSKPTPNVWTVMQKWVFALPTTCETEIERKSILQKELERIVADLGDTPGLGGNGVPPPKNNRSDLSLTPSILAGFWSHGPPQRQRYCTTAFCFG